MAELFQRSHVGFIDGLGLGKRGHRALGVAAFAGCARPAGPVFPRVDPPIVFPPPPDVARIEYVGELRTDRDLKPAASGWKVLGEALTGPPPERAVSAPAGGS